MGSGIIRADFFAKQIVGASVFENDIFLANQQEIRDAMGRIIGEGVIDPTFSGLGLVDDAGAINNRRLTVTGNLPGQNAQGYVFKNAGNSGSLQTVTEGSRTIKLHDPTWYEDLPFENADSTTYRVYLSEAVWPVSVGVGKNGGRGYSRAVNGVGVVMNPSLVTDTGTFIQFQFSPADLNSAFGIQMWNLDPGNREDPDYSYDCVVWLDTDQAGVNIQTDDSDVAIAFEAKLVMDSGGSFLKIDLSGIGDGKLGQSVVDTDPTHYKVAILGPLITTSNFDSDPAYLHVGITDSAIGGETIDTSGQIVFLSVSQAVAQTIEAPDELSYKGWIVAPTTSFTATDIDITGTGEAFINGIVVDTPIQLNLAPVSPSAVQYVYFDGAAGDYKITDSASTAFGNNNLPLIQGTSDGGSQFILTTVMRIPRRARRLNVAAEITVSENLSHRCMFTDLEEAFTYASSFQTALGAGNEIGVEIEVRGDTNLTGILDIPGIYDLTDVVIKGRHTPVIQRGGGAYSSTAGSRIIWGYSGPIFDLEAGQAMRGWTFKNLEFRYTNGANISGAACVIRSKTGAVGLDSVTFQDCTVDGNNVLAAQGGGNGQLGSLLKVDGGIVNGLKVDNCAIYVNAAFILNEGDAGLQNLRVTNCLLDNNDVAPALGGTEQGGIIDMTIAGASASNWIVNHNRGRNMTGALVKAYRLTNSFIDHNDYTVDSQAPASPVIDLGNLGNSACYRIIIDHNKFASRSVVADTVVSIVSGEDGTDFTGIMLDHNIIDGDNVAGMNGIEVAGYITNADFVKGVIVGSNMIVNVDQAIVFGRTLQATVTNNIIQAAENATSIAGDSSGASGLSSYTVSGNYVELVGSISVAFDDSQTSEYDSASYQNNFVDLTGVTTEARAFNFDGFVGGNSLNNIVGGNTVIGGTAVTVDRGVDESGITLNTYIGNLFLNVETFMDTSSNTFIGNLCTGLLTIGAAGWDTARIIGSRFATEGGLGQDIDLNMSNTSVVGCAFDPDDQLTIDGNDTFFIGCRMSAADISNVFVDTPSDVFFVGCDFTVDEITIDDGSGCTFVGSLLGKSSSGDVFVQNNSDNVSFVGCTLIPPLTIPALNDDLIMVASRHGQSATIDSTSGTLTGNEFFGLTLSATSDNIAAVANIIVASPIVDNGTANQVANNVDT